jgi:hypothetical protein
MNKIILLLLTLIFFYNLNAQQDNQGTNNKVTFKLKISEIENPDSVGIVWLILPYVEGKTVEQVSYFPKVLDANGFYHQTITFADSLVGKSIAYLYVAKDKYDFWRNFVVEKNQDLDRIESWGFVDGLEGRMRPTVMLF